MKTWSSRLGVGREADKLTLKKKKKFVEKLLEEAKAHL
jgi:hypothetical protein